MNFHFLHPIISLLISTFLCSIFMCFSKLFSTLKVNADCLQASCLLICTFSCSIFMCFSMLFSNLVVNPHWLQPCRFFELISSFSQNLFDFSTRKNHFKNDTLKISVFCLACLITVLKFRKTTAATQYTA